MAIFTYIFLQCSISFVWFSLQGLERGKGAGK